MEVKAKIKSKDSIELLEDAKKGDIINLRSLEEIDLSIINESIRCSEEPALLMRIREAQENTRLEVENKFKAENEALKAKLDALNKDKDLSISNAVNEVKLSSTKELSIIKEEHSKEVTDLNNKIAELNQVIAALQVEKSNTGTKVLGEELEQWCYNEISKYMQNGLSNCTLSKDNNAVDEFGQLVKGGTKGDFIFNIYTDDDHTQLLASVMLEMKNQGAGKSEKHNDDFYDKLDKDRTKKGCKYALLVSQLDMNDNYLVMQRVLEYPDMYIVRPFYLTTFLNMLVSLCKKFANIIKEEKEEGLQALKEADFEESFETLTTKFLDKPIQLISKYVEEIDTKSNTIIKAANDIKILCDEKISEILRKNEASIDAYKKEIQKSFKRRDK